MKILIVAPLPPYYRGGIERVVAELAPRLVRDNDVEVHVWSGTLGRAQTCDWNGVHLRTFQTNRRIAYASFSMLLALKRFASDVDVIHAHGSSTLIPFVAALAAGRTPLVISPHFHIQASNKLLGVLKIPFERTANRYALGKAKKVICVSLTEADTIRSRFSIANRIVIIRNGVNIDEIQSAKPYEFDGMLILYVGRLERYKNLQRVVEAVTYLPQNFVLYVIGDGSYKKELELIIQQNKLAGRVRLLGSCPDKELFRWVQTSAILVNLSEIEAFGITVIEALAAGKPVLVNDAFGLHELAERFQGAVFGIDARTTSALELAKKLQDVVRVHSAVDLDEYHWDRIASRTLAFYNDVACHKE